MNRIQIFEIWQELDMARYLPVYPTGTGIRTGQCDGCAIALHADDVHEVV